MTFGAQVAQVDEPLTTFVVELEAYPEGKVLSSAVLIVASESFVRQNAKICKKTYIQTHYNLIYLSMMNWDNDGWASRHISKHNVNTLEAWQAAFEDSKAKPLESPDQLRYPPYRRYWTIGVTAKGRLLLVVWEQHRAVRNLITAFEPSPERIRIYEAKTKKRQR